jgi:hypothetical protein
MNTRRLTTAGVALVAAMSFGLAGCSGNASTGGATDSSPSASSAAPQLEPSEELSAAAQKLNQDTAKTTFTMAGVTGTGAVDPTAKKLRMTMNLGAGNQSIKTEMIVLSNDVYLRLDGVPNLSGKWLHVDATKLAAGNQLRQMSSGDPVGATNLLSSVTDVQRVGEHSFQGTLDFTKSPTVDKRALQTLGDKAKAVPFTAKTDEQGRLTELTVDMDSVQAGLGELKATYSDFGTPVTVEKPAASEVEEASADVLRSFGG